MMMMIDCGRITDEDDDDGSLVEFDDDDAVN